MQFEVMSYPQNHKMEHDEFHTAFEKASEQLHKGRKFFETVVIPAAKLSDSWTWMGFVCAPQIQDRDAFKEKIDIPENKLPFILTRTELDNNEKDWLSEIKLKTTVGSLLDYGNLIAVCVCSQRVSFRSQIFSYEDATHETITRIIGSREEGEVMGVGGGGKPLPTTEAMTFSQLKEKSLGHVWNVLFWNDTQMELLRNLRERMFTIIFGDFGGGKTSVLGKPSN